MTPLVTWTRRRRVRRPSALPFVVAALAAISIAAGLTRALLGA